MSIMTRFIRIWKADVHGVMDQLEDKGLLLRQCLRDMEKELELKEGKLRGMRKSLEQARQEQDRYSRDCAKHEQDLNVAVEKERDDIARMLIKKIAPLKKHLEMLTQHIDVLAADIASFAAAIADQRRQYEELQMKAAEYFRREEQKQWQESLFAIMPSSSIPAELSAEEVELELLRYKEARGGVSS